MQIELTNPVFDTPRTRVLVQSLIEEAVSMEDYNYKYRFFSNCRHPNQRRRKVQNLDVFSTQQRSGAGTDGLTISERTLWIHSSEPQLSLRFRFHTCKRLSCGLRLIPSRDICVFTIHSVEHGSHAVTSARFGYAELYFNRHIH